MTEAKDEQGLEGPEPSHVRMGMSWSCGQPDDDESIRVLHRSRELGLNFWDWAEIYGPFKNEELLGRALQGRARDKVIIATKFAWEFGPGTIRRAHKAHPLSAVQSEYSLWERGVESKVAPTLRELGIGFVAYSPMDRGFLAGNIAGNIHSLDDLEASDERRNNPRLMR